MRLGSSRLGLIDGVIAEEGAQAEGVADRGGEVASEDGAFIAASDVALAYQPDVQEQIRYGKGQPAGAVIGAVMNSMGCRADAARVCELELDKSQA